MINGGCPPSGNDPHIVKKLASCFQAGADDTNLFLRIRSLCTRSKECRNASELVLIDLHRFRLLSIQPVPRGSSVESGLADGVSAPGHAVQANSDVHARTESCPRSGRSYDATAVCEADT